MRSAAYLSRPILRLTTTTTSSLPRFRWKTTCAYFIAWATLALVAFALGAGLGVQHHDDVAPDHNNDIRKSAFVVPPASTSSSRIIPEALVLEPTKQRVVEVEEKEKTQGKCERKREERYDEIEIPRLSKSRATGLEVDVKDIQERRCPNASRARSSTELVEEKKQFERLLDDLIMKQACGRQISEEEFVCSARCPVEEPELERSVRIMRMAEHDPDYVLNACKSRVFPYLVWISKGGRIRFFNCVGTFRSDAFMGKEVWREDMRVLFTLGCIVNLPEDVVFGFDWSDYASPGFTGAPHDTYKYLVPLPPIIRPVGTDAYHSLLFPTGSFLVATAFCHFRRPDRWWELCIAHERGRDSVPWERRISDIMWRGAPNGVQWTVNDWRMMQRSRLVRDFGRVPGFDVAFVQDIHARSENDQNSYAGVEGVKRIAARNQVFPPGTPRILDPEEVVKEMQREWVKKNQIVKDETPKYRHLLHVDGQTASWGITHKLNSGGVVLWMESARDYREFFYKLLTPWVHYIPVAKDASDLHSVKNWLDKNQHRAKKIARNMADFADARLRAQDTLCYVYRLLKSIKAAQSKGTIRADEAYMRSKLGDSYSRLEDIRDYSEWLPAQKAKIGKTKRV